MDRRKEEALNSKRLLERSYAVLSSDGCVVLIVCVRAWGRRRCVKSWRR